MNIQKSFNGGDPQQSHKGTLFLVATPIGNMEDITYRAIRILGSVDWIAAEDTRHTRKLLTHYEISTRLISYHEHNKQASGTELIRRLIDGESIALVSDAGMPAISDPGYELVKLAADCHICVVSIPGANAALSALVVSGLPTNRFVFLGFLPRDKKNVRTDLEHYKNVTETIIMYESPHRILKTLDHILQVWGDRQMALVRELTKKFEEIARGSITECLAWLSEHPPLGEYCLIMEGKAQGELERERQIWWEELTVEDHVKHYTTKCGSQKEAIKLTAVDRNVPKREIYNQLIYKNPLA